MESEKIPVKKKFNKKELTLRWLTAIFWIPLIIYIIYLGSYFYATFIILLCAFTSYEFLKILEYKNMAPHKLFGAIMGAIIVITMFYRSYFFLFLTLATGYLVISIFELARKKADKPIYHISSTIMGAFFIPWLLGHLVFLRELPRVFNLPYINGFYFTLLPFLMGWGGDSGAYFIGIAFGKHKLLPRVSPKKSWEGAIGNVVFTIVAVLLIKLLSGNLLNYFDVFTIGIFGSILSQIGDLTESLIKRDIAIKDSSKFLPGHGGLLDRFDGFLFMVPFVYYYLYVKLVIML
ncbi:phosphatidate cytidylyltransferase [candidate division WOR-3 bacterium]|nr:phosphatidate cytidylyltransferase [candidate division WOR-3 bacterium]